MRNIVLVHGFWHALVLDADHQPPRRQANVIGRRRPRRPRPQVIQEVDTGRERRERPAA
ncbi:hypothetical protein ACPPVO_32780 [Dactylosporangium sp. McL0621]|uniref:hypothetical protein n=1 Tax=Dactylosporangium sp. McL0621 TaxID=3415678 RepID=UPI003CE70F13